MNNAAVFQLDENSQIDMLFEKLVLRATHKKTSGFAKTLNRTMKFLLLPAAALYFGFSIYQMNLRDNERIAAKAKVFTDAEPEYERYMAKINKEYAMRDSIEMNKYPVVSYTSYLDKQVAEIPQPKKEVELSFKDNDLVQPAVAETMEVDSCVEAGAVTMDIPALDKQKMDSLSRMKTMQENQDAIRPGVRDSIANILRSLRPQNSR